jgi:endonuclease III
MNLRRLLKKHGTLYSQELGIDVEEEPFKWFLASILFGGRISTTIAKNTYKAYEEARLTTPERIAQTNMWTLIDVHGRGGYARYDGITAEYMLDITKKLLRDYDGDVRKLDELSNDPTKLEQRLQDFRGVGPVTARIFLRELRGIWKNADPQPTQVEVIAAKELGIIESDKNVLETLKTFWARNRVEGYEFRNFEAALVRIGLKLRRGKELEAISQ